MRCEIDAEAVNSPVNLKFCVHRTPLRVFLLHIFLPVWAAEIPKALFSLMGQLVRLLMDAITSGETRFATHQKMLRFHNNAKMGLRSYPTFLTKESSRPFFPTFDEGSLSPRLIKRHFSSPEILITIVSFKKTRRERRPPGSPTLENVSGRTSQRERWQIEREVARLV